MVVCLPIASDPRIDVLAVHLCARHAHGVLSRWPLGTNQRSWTEGLGGARSVWGFRKLRLKSRGAFSGRICATTTGVSAEFGGATSGAATPTAVVAFQSACETAGSLLKPRHGACSWRVKRP